MMRTVITNTMRTSLGGPVAWFELPLLFYFMVHFFPPMPSGLANISLGLGVVGVLWECHRDGWRGFGRLRHPLVVAWGLFVGLMLLSLLQVPDELLRESWRRLNSDLLKHSLFALALLLYLQSESRARRVIFAGVLACCVMLGFCLVEIIAVASKTGKLPFQRDYLFYLMFFFPFPLVAYRFEPRWRYLAFGLAVATIALAFLSGFRGAVLALLVMSLGFAILGRMWGILWAGAFLAVAGLVVLTWWFPEQANYVLAKFQQINDSGRWSGHWRPAWEMANQVPWTGFGYGHHVFSQQFGLQMNDHPWWTRAWSDRLGWLPGSPHSVFFETLFIAGWIAVISLFSIVAGIIGALVGQITRRRKELFSSPWLALSLAVLVAAVGNFLVFYQTEDPSWRTAPVIVMLAVACLRALKSPETGSERKRNPGGA